MSDESLSRRDLLRSGVISSPFILSGCIEGTLGRFTSATGGAPETAFEEITFEGTNLLVQWSDSVELSKVNLISPNGKSFSSKSVNEGATAVSLPILNLASGRHYSSGTHELVGVSGDSTVTSTDIELAAELVIESVRQYSGDRPTPTNLGNIAVQLRNKGSAPTWVYNIGYRDAPYEKANQLIDASNNPTRNLHMPRSPEGTVVQPGASQVFVSSTPPNIIGNNKACDGWNSNSQLVVQIANGETIQQSIHSTFSGEVVSANFRDTCSEISIERTSTVHDE